MTPLDHGPASAASTFTATIDLPPERRSVPVARRVLSELLASWAAEHYRDDAGLLLSELVTNVTRHARSRANMVLEIRLSEPGLRVAVIDSSAAAPVLDRSPGTAPGGHGLKLVAAISDRWGSEAHLDGKRVWFELRRVAPDAPPSGCTP